jgi:hypothetical protein
MLASKAEARVKVLTFSHKHWNLKKERILAYFAIASATGKERFIALTPWPNVIKLFYICILGMCIIS